MGVIAIQNVVIGAVLNAFAALFFWSPPIMRAFQAASQPMSILFGMLFVGLGLIAVYGVAKDIM